MAAQMSLAGLASAVQPTKKGGPALKSKWRAVKYQVASAQESGLSLAAEISRANRPKRFAPAEIKDKGALSVFVIHLVAMGCLSAFAWSSEDETEPPPVDAPGMGEDGAGSGGDAPRSATKTEALPIYATCAVVAAFLSMPAGSSMGAPGIGRAFFSKKMRAKKMLTPIFIDFGWRLFVSRHGVVPSHAAPRRGNNQGHAGRGGGAHGDARHPGLRSELVRENGERARAPISSRQPRVVADLLYIRVVRTISEHFLQDSRRRNRRKCSESCEITQLHESTTLFLTIGRSTKISAFSLVESFETSAGTAGP